MALETLKGRRGAALSEALYRHRPLSRAGLSERFFARLFTGLVYAQIWEDPEVDIAAMKLGEGHRIVTIASGGCNVLAYLTTGPAAIDAVDLNPHHIALNRLKLAAFMHLPGHGDVTRFLAMADQPHNSAAFDYFLAPKLEPATRDYWRGRDRLGRRRIRAFDGNIYQTGLLGRFIAAAHAIARLHGTDPREIMKTRSVAAQRAFFDRELAPLFDRPLVRFLTGRRASLFGLGIPPAQYDALVNESAGETMADVLRERLRKLACDFSLRDNHFAWQAFARRYGDAGEMTLPRHLDAAHHRTIRANASRVALHRRDITALLGDKPAGSVDRVVLLDAQDWMTDAQLNALWTEITRTTTPGARVIFRTAGERCILPGRLSPSLLSQWRRDEEASRKGTAGDRSAIYGGFHVYEKR